MTLAVWYALEQAGLPWIAGLLVHLVLNWIFRLAADA